MAQPLDTVAIALYNSLTADTDFDIPEFDLSGPEYDLPGGADNPALDAITKLTNGDLTNAVLAGASVTGTGTMDVLMNTFMLHLDREYKSGHITGAEYTKAYIASIQVAASNGVQYLVQRDSAYWQAVTAQMGIINSRVALAIAKTQLAGQEIDANTAKVNYALTKSKLGTENANYISISEQGENARAQTKDNLADGSAVMGVTKLQKDLLSTQQDLAEMQIILTKEQGETARASTLDTRSDGTPVLGTIKLQNELLSTQTEVAAKQVILVSEQGEAQRAQTLDTRLDGSTVTGLLGKQKELYSQQITSYKRDAEVKAGKLWIDAWITMKTIDEGLLPPDQFTNTEINEVLATLKTNNVLGSA